MLCQQPASQLLTGFEKAGCFGKDSGFGNMPLGGLLGPCCQIECTASCSNLHSEANTD